MARKKPSKGSSGGDSGSSANFNFSADDFNPDITFTFKPRPAVITRDLNRFAGDIRSFREPLTLSVRQVLAPSFRKNFTVGGRPKWEPRAASTSEHAVGRLMNVTGNLREAASSPSIWNISTTSARVAGLPAKVSYGAAHQQGYSFKTRSKTKGRTVDVPARPFLVIQPEDMIAIERIFYGWIEVKARRRGFPNRIGR